MSVQEYLQANQNFEKYTVVFVPSSNHRFSSNATFDRFLDHSAMRVVIGVRIFVTFRFWRTAWAFQSVNRFFQHERRKVRTLLGDHPRAHFFQFVQTQRGQTDAITFANDGRILLIVSALHFAHQIDKVRRWGDLTTIQGFQKNIVHRLNPR